MPRFCFLYNRLGCTSYNYPRGFTIAINHCPLVKFNICGSFYLKSLMGIVRDLICPAIVIVSRAFRMQRTSLDVGQHGQMPQSILLVSWIYIFRPLQPRIRQDLQVIMSLGCYLAMARKFKMPGEQVTYCYFDYSNDAETSILRCQINELPEHNSIPRILRC